MNQSLRELASELALAILPILLGFIAKKRPAPDRLAGDYQLGNSDA